MSTHDNHMDDLFRRAADAYPLHDSGSNWSKISSRISAKGSVQEMKETDGGQGKKKRRGLFWWIPAFLLVGLAGGWWMNSQFEIYGDQKRQGPKHSNKISGNLFSDRDNDRKEKTSSPAEILISKPTGREMLTADLPTHLRHGQQLSEQILSSPQAPSHFDQNPDHIFPENDDYLPMEHFPISDAPDEHIPDKNSEVLQSLPLPYHKVPMHSLAIYPEILKNETHQQYHLSVSEKNDEASLVHPTSRSHQPAAWYGGLQTGMAVSTIEKQKLIQPGWVIGLFGGYHISPSLSVESGLRLTRKHYYTSGDHFKMKNSDPSMPTDMTIISINGSSNVFEIPLKFRYSFSSNARGNYFVGAGINTFILTREANDYLVFRNGVSSNMEAVYNNNQSYLAATMEVSGGFEAMFKNKKSLRIEPYIQVAIKGIGVGSLPVSGGGLLIGYSIFR